MTPSRPAADGPSWVVRVQPRPRARLRLFCVPHAGGGASAYALWPPSLPPEVELCAVQLPGREARYREPLFTDVHALTPALCDGLVDLLDRPFALFGHSLGAVVAYEAAGILERDHGVSPALLIVSGHGAPHLPRRSPSIHHLPDAAFLEAVRRLNGTPAEVWRRPELLEVILPPLRADFRMSETYLPRSAGKLGCPLLALGSTEDERVALASLAAWREVTAGPFQTAMFPGDHFYLQTHRPRLLEFLSTQLRRLLD